jgi:hypothetical protein
MTKISIFLLLLAFVIGACNSDHLIKNSDYREKTLAMFEKQKELAKGRSQQLFSVFDQNIKVEEKEALQFLYAYMPLSDLADYDGNFFLKQVQYLLKAKNEMVWGKTIPEEVFLHFVLPLRVNNENLDSFRSVFYSELKDRVKNLSMREAALEVNHWCHEKVTYRGSDERTISPMNIVRTSFGRCGEESTFTVTALRTVGIPARQVYTPRWAHSDDNHAWVEVWVDGKWYFMGACEPEADLNMGWFAEPARRAMLVHTRAYGHYEGTEPVIMDEKRFSELNLIANYAPVKKFHVKVTDNLGKPVDSAKVEYQLYNYCEFYPIASNYCGKDGLTSVTTGLGDLIVWATKGQDFGYQKITVEQTDTVNIQIGNQHNYDLVETYQLVPPIQRQAKEVSAAGKEKNALRLKTEDEIRAKYMSTFKDTAWAKNLATELKLNADSLVRIIHLSYGNWMEIEQFLRNAKEKLPWAFQMLHFISEKDLRDTKADVLLNHLENAFVNLAEKTALSDKAFYGQYVISPRIGNELLRPWRNFMQTSLKTEFGEPKPSVQVLAEWIKKNIVIDNEANLHSRSPLSPQGVFELRIADFRSRNIFFVAACRSLGIAARLNPATNMPQYFANNQWNNQYFEPIPVKPGKGFVHFVNGNPNINPKYALHFTIARFENGNFRTFELDFWKELDKFPTKVEVETGRYMLVTGNRLDDGSVLSSISYFEVKDGQVTDVKVSVLEKVAKQESYGSIEPSGFEVEKFGQAEKLKLADLAKKGAILIWMEPDKEPTRHVMADIPLVSKEFENWGGSLLFLLTKEKTTPSFKPSNFTGLPKQSLFVTDPESKLLKEIERTHCSAFKSAYPIIVVISAKGNIVYYSEGYKIGIGEQLLKAVKKVKN